MKTLKKNAEFCILSVGGSDQPLRKLTTKFLIFLGCKNADYSSACRTEFRMNYDDLYLYSVLIKKPTLPLADAKDFALILSAFVRL
jgi:hypothetical protein